MYTSADESPTVSRTIAVEKAMSRAENLKRNATEVLVLTDEASL
jgi:hypothetical protein